MLSRTWLQLTSAQRRPRQAPEAGLTLIESLVAMLLITVTVSLITPPIFLITATRVQQRRAEQALSIAQSEIDRIRLLMEQGTAIPDADNPVPSADELGTFADIEDVPAPTGTDLVADRTQLAAATDWYPVDLNNDGNNDYFVQLFRANDRFIDRNGNNSRDADEPVQRFDLGVRVYQVNAADFPGNLETEANIAIGTSGRGFVRSPLAALYTQAVDTNSDESFQLF